MLIPMKVDYGIRLVSFLASKPKGNLFKAQDISKEKHIPFQYLLQISNSLIKSKLISGHRGPNGGYSLNKDPGDISIGDIIRSLDHSVAPVACIKTPEGCELSGDCSQQEMWKKVEQLILNQLEKISIKSLNSEKIIFESLI